MQGTGAPVDLLDPANMQPSVLKSLEEFVRLYSVDTRAPDRPARARTILAELLDGARAARGTVRRFRLGDAGLRRADWLVIAGLGEDTRTAVEVQRVDGKIRFHIDDDQFGSQIPTRQTGDHTVPLVGALPPFIPESQVACVMRKDLSFLEFRDRAMVALGGFHSLLPEVNLVQRLVAKFLRPTYSGKIWGRRVPGVRNWNPPIDGLAPKEKKGY